jgi:hypothetical protein
MKTRELKVYIFQPVVLKVKNEQTKNEQHKLICHTAFPMPYFPIKEGDMVAVGKRPATTEEVKRQKTYKVEKVEINAHECSIIATTEPATFTDEKEMNRFLDGKSKIV